MLTRNVIFASLVGIPVFVLGAGRVDGGTISPTVAKSLVSTPGLGISIVDGEVLSSYPSNPNTGSEWRGVIEFDLTTLIPKPNASVVLYLRDTGGYVPSDSTTSIYYYVGDGTVASADYARLDHLLFPITRPWKGSPSTTLHDVTFAVNAIALGGAQYIGFLFVPASTLGRQEDAFGSFGTFVPTSNETNFTSGLVYSDTPAAVPLPVVGSGVPGFILAGGLLAWWRQRRQRCGQRPASSLRA